jgi:hypothetical protein
LDNGERYPCSHYGFHYANNADERSPIVLDNSIKSGAFFLTALYSTASPIDWSNPHCGIADEQKKKITE